LIEKVKELRGAMRLQWMRENKAFGFDIIAMRLGSLISMIEHNGQTISDWLEGSLDRIEELEAPRLPYEPIPENGDPYIMVNRWLQICGQNMANMHPFS